MDDNKEITIPQKITKKYVDGQVYFAEDVLLTNDTVNDIIDVLKESPWEAY